MRRITPGCLGMWSDGSMIFYLCDSAITRGDMEVYEYSLRNNTTYMYRLNWVPLPQEGTYE